MEIKKFTKATIDYFKYLSEYPTDYTRQREFVDLVQNNNSVLEILLQKLWQPNKTVTVGQVIWSPNMPANIMATVTTAGTTSGIEPNWEKDSVVDGNVTYIMREYIGNWNVSLLDAFPIGYIMLTMDGNNPASIFGGEWRLINTGVVLINACNNYVAGMEYGSDEVVLKINELPSHSHSGTISGGSHNHSISCENNSGHIHYTKYGASSGTRVPKGTSRSGDSIYDTSSSGTHAHTITVATSSSHSHTFAGGNTGGGGAHNNKQPYRAVYMWERIA